MLAMGVRPELLEKGDLLEDFVHVIAHSGILPRHQRKRRKSPNGVLALPARWISLIIALLPSGFYRLK
jgi:hypothetical protein